MLFTVNNRSSRYFEIQNEQGDNLGAIEFDNWRFHRAVITTVDNNIYKLVPVGFWQTTTAVTKNDFPFAQMKSNMRGGLTLTFENGLSFIFKRKGILRSEYVLVNNEGTDIVATVQAIYRWRKFSFEYTVELHSGMHDREYSLYMPFLLVYCARYIQMRQAAVT